MTGLSISVYVHFPWCLKKCPYCDFHSVAAPKTSIPHEKYAQAVIRELQWRSEQIADQRLESIFIGGGTPSLWEAEEVGRVLKAIFGRFRSTADQVEVTVECNPSSLDRPKAAALAGVGVNRLSVGVQSLDASHLRFLDRIHDPADALRALAAARSEVQRVNADLIFGIPGQTASSFAQTLNQLADMGIAHISAYGLTVEPGTRFGALQREGRLRIASEQLFVESFWSAHRALKARGFDHYEVSNYAKPGQRARHNLRYWHGEPYLGLGADAVGSLHGAPGRARRYRNLRDPMQYIQSSATAAIEVFEEKLGPKELVREGLMLGLRTSDGVDLETLKRRAGADPLVDRRDAVERAITRSDLVLDAGSLRVPLNRWLVLDRIIADVF
jgi:putative oxygen-independent coproporphyrinogen III oxidase